MTNCLSEYSESQQDGYFPASLILPDCFIALYNLSFFLISGHISLLIHGKLSDHDFYRYINFVDALLKSASKLIPQF